MNLEAYLDVLRSAHGGMLPLNDDQRNAVEHYPSAPLWIIAGPGTGKTHTLVWLVYRRLLVDRVPPEQIVLTTFTRKAAAELQSRLIAARERLLRAGVTEVATMDISKLILGTLHSICARVLQDQRYEPTLRVRVLEDELAQQFFLRRYRNSLVQDEDLGLWQRFKMIDAAATYPPSQARRAELATKLFNRLTENSADINTMLTSGDADMIKLAQGYQAYQQSLSEEGRTDQAHLQAHFLAFLATPVGRIWAQRFTVIVDEYQDTNPIQEQIYFRLATMSGDITVVGDDDQSLYRFRGATVESLIDFDRACRHFLRSSPVQVNLRENRRSHPIIVEWVNRYIDAHPLMQDPVVRVRAPGKRKLIAASDVGGSYPAVMAIAESTYKKAADKVATAIADLYTDGLIVDYSQVALLTFSTRETSQSIGAFTSALRQRCIPLYNPRSGRAHVDPLFLQMLGALIAILDSDGSGVPEHLPRGVPEYIQRARDAYQTLSTSSVCPELITYVDRSAVAVRAAPISQAAPVTYLTRRGGRRVTVSGLLYKLLAQEPFATGMTEAEASSRLKALNLILAEYESLYSDGELKLELRPDGTTAVEHWTLYNFYTVLVEGIHDKLNDSEDDEVSIQPGMVNVMTIHQSKGLEFEVVFVLRPDKQPWVGDTHIMEDELDAYITRPTKPAMRRSREMRAAEDAIRLFFVAYSRAKRLLVLTGNREIKEWSRVLPLDATGHPIAGIESLQRAGVHIL